MLDIDVVRRITLKVAGDVCRRHHRTKDHTEDAASYAWAKVWDILPSFDPTKYGNVTQWVYLKGKFAVYDYLRSARVIERSGRTVVNFVSLDSPYSLLNNSLLNDLHDLERPNDRSMLLADPASDHSRPLEVNSQFKTIMGLVKLSPREAELIQLVYWGEMSQTEAAEVMGISSSRASQLHGSALSKLRSAARKLETEKERDNLIRAEFALARKAAERMAA